MGTRSWFKVVRRETETGRPVVNVTYRVFGESPSDARLIVNSVYQDGHSAKCTQVEHVRTDRVRKQEPSSSVAVHCFSVVKA